MRKKKVVKIGFPENLSLKWFNELIEAVLEIPNLKKRIDNLEQIVRRNLPEYKDKLNILIWRNVGGLGDIIMQSVIPKVLKLKYPKSRITFQVPKRYLSIPKHNPFVDKSEEAVNPFSGDGYDLAIKLSNPCPAAVYESVKSPNITRNRIDLFLEKAGFSIDSRELIFKLKEEERKWAEDFLKKHKALRKVRIGFELRSAEIRRDWEIENYRFLASLIKKKIKNSIIFIFDHDKEMSWLKEKGIINICGFRLEQVAALVEKMHLMICPDSGLAHLAGALNVPILGLFGPTNPHFRLQTYKRVDWIWLKDKFLKRRKKCMPCWYGFNCGDSLCMKAITPEMVFDKVKDMINKYAKS